MKRAFEGWAVDRNGERFPRERFSFLTQRRGGAKTQRDKRERSHTEALRHRGKHAYALTMTLSQREREWRAGEVTYSN